MNKTNDMDNYSNEDTVNQFHAFSDVEHSLLPNTGEFPSDGLEYVDTDAQPPTETVEDPGDSAMLCAEDADRLRERIRALRPDVRVAALAALACTQLEMERQAQKNRELNARMRELTSLLNTLVREPENRAADGDENNTKLCADLDGAEDYLRALTTQTGKLETMLDSLTEMHAEVSELNAALDEDLDACNGLASQMQADENQLVELESLVDRLCGADPSSNEIREDTVASELPNVEYLETLAEMHVKDLETLAAVHLRDRDMLTELDADNRLLVATKGDHVVKCPLSRTIVTIGRGRSNDIQIRTRGVSRSHARIMTNDSDAIIEDMHSKNGIFVNGRGVQLKQLNNGDIVDIGEIRFKFIDLMADERAADNDPAADESADTAPELRNRRDRRDRRERRDQHDQGDQGKVIRADFRTGRDSVQVAETQPIRAAQPAKKRRWKFWV